MIKYELVLKAEFNGDLTKSEIEKIMQNIKSYGLFKIVQIRKYDENDRLIEEKDLT